MESIRRVPRRAVFTFVAVTLAAPAGLRAQTSSFGPLSFEEGSPLQRISYTHATEAADPVPRRKLQTDMWMGYSNIFVRDSTATHDLFLDMERLLSAASVRYGLTDDFELGGRISWETSGGGILDDFISDFHQALGMGNADRARYPSGAYAQRLRDGSGRLRLDVPRAKMRLDDVRLFAKWRALGGRAGRGTLSLRGVARLPTQENRAGPERADLALMALARTSWGRWHLHATAGGSTVRVARDYAGLLRSSSWFADLAVERNLAASLSAIVQYSFATPRLRGIGDSLLDGVPGNLLLGAAGKITGSWRWDVSFQEDVPASSPSVDFTLGLSVRRRW